MKLRFAALSLAVVTMSVTAHAAETNSFALLSSKGETVGKASYTLEKTKDGFRLKSQFQYEIAVSAMAMRMSGEDDTSGKGSRHMSVDGRNLVSSRYVADYKLDANGNFLAGGIQNQSAQSMLSFSPTKKRDALTVNTMQSSTMTTDLSIPVPKPDFLLAPNYDPGPIQVLILTAINHPHADSFYMLVLPAAPGHGDITEEVAIQPAPAVAASGTLDGKPVELKHFLMNYHSGHADLYTDADGKLMEADLGPLSARYVRTSFILTPQ